MDELSKELVIMVTKWRFCFKKATFSHFRKKGHP